MTTQIATFNPKQYPKSYASLDGWRLHEYTHLHVDDQHRVYKQLEQFCLSQAEHCSAIDTHQQLTLLGSGWEWSVFAKDDTTVLKVPAGIFPEVNTPKYLANAQKAYQLLSNYYPTAMLAQTRFIRQGGLNMIEQARLRGQDSLVIDFAQADEWLLTKLKTFLEATAKLIEEQHWLPDFWLDQDPNGFILRNVMIHPNTDQFTIVDFTTYLDPARMYPDLCHQHIQRNAARVESMLNQVNKNLAAKSR